MENLARFGYVVRGLVYVVIGVLALQVAFGGGGALTDPQGAIAVMGKSAFGAILFSTLALIPPLMQNLYGYTVMGTGLVLAPRGLGSIVSTLLLRA